MFIFDSGLSFEVFFRTHFARYCYHANIVLNDRDLSEDVAQEAFAGLWEKREEFTSEKAAKAWLFTVVRHKALNHIRHQKVVSKTLPQLEGDETQCLNVSA